MSLTLYYHPLSSFCWKALIAFYDAGVPFEPEVVDLSDPEQRAAFQAIWPLGKFPVLRDEARGRTVPESTIIIDYLAQHYPTAAGLIPPNDRSVARGIRFLDRVIDNYIHLPFQRIVRERLRPDGPHDTYITDQSLNDVRQGYDLIASMIAEPWATGEAFTLVDCAALPALYYGDYAVPLAGWPALTAYLERLKARSSVTRVLEEAEPYFKYFPLARDR